MLIILKAILNSILMYLNCQWSSRKWMINWYIWRSKRTHTKPTFEIWGRSSRNPTGEGDQPSISWMQDIMRPRNIQIINPIRHMDTMDVGIEGIGIIDMDTWKIMTIQYMMTISNMESIMTYWLIVTFVNKCKTSKIYWIKLELIFKTIIEINRTTKMFST